MGLEKLGMSLAQKTSAWVKACGKTSVLQTKPIKFAELKGVKYFSKQNTRCAMDTFELTTTLKGITKKEMDLIASADDLSAKEYMKIIANTPKSGEFYSICTGSMGNDSPNAIINAYLRTGKIHPRYTKREIEDLVYSVDDIISKNKLNNNTTLYRRVNSLSHIPEAGETYIEKGYTATSRNAVFSDYGYGSNFIEIIVPAGTNCFIPNNYFQEVLIGRNKMYKVVERTPGYAQLLLLN